MGIHLRVAGWSPRSYAAGQNWMELRDWLQGVIRSGELTRRQNPRTPRERWQWERSLGGGSRESCDQKAWDYSLMGSNQFTKGPGWVIGRRVETGGPSAHQNDVDYFFCALRCLPVVKQKAEYWGYNVDDLYRERLVIGYNQQYNRTLEARLRAHRPLWAWELHDNAVHSMHAQAQRLILTGALQIAVSAGSGEAFNPVPIAGEIGGRLW
jgi:hypothetical protein